MLLNFEVGWVGDSQLKQRSLYVKPPDEDKSDHVHEASSKLLARLQEAVGCLAIELIHTRFTLQALNTIYMKGMSFLNLLFYIKDATGLLESTCWTRPHIIPIASTLQV